jgi:hypothetical protein
LLAVKNRPARAADEDATAGGGNVNRRLTSFIAAVGLLLAACRGDGGAPNPTPTLAPSSTPEIALTAAPIQSPPASFTARPSPTLPVFEGVIMVNAEGAGADWLQTDDGEAYGIEGITDDVESQIAALRDGETLVRVYGTLLQPVDDVANRQIRVSRIERAVE